MSGLTLTLKPNEKFLVGGNLVQNGPRRGSIRVGDDVFVLRLSDALHPDEVTTPLRRAYHVVQLILAGELSADEGIADVRARWDVLMPIFAEAGAAEQMENVSTAIDARRYYSAIVGMKALFGLEDELLCRGQPTDARSNATLHATATAR